MATLCETFFGRFASSKGSLDSERKELKADDASSFP